LEAVEGGACRDGHGRRLLEREIGRLDGQRGLVHGRELGERAGALPVDLVTRPEAPRVRTGRLHDPGHVESTHRIFGPETPNPMPEPTTRMT
jgi:hypothetical protein